MTEIIAGVEVPETVAVAEATRHIRGMTSPLIFHHSRRVFFFASLHAREVGLRPDPELLYLSAIFHDLGLMTPYSDVEQRFEIDSADHARKFLLDHDFSATAADVAWEAVALHSTPGIPGRMGPEIAATNHGVLTDVLGVGLEELDRGLVDEITAVHPRGDFKNGFLQALLEGTRDRPDTTYATISSDVLMHFVPGFRHVGMVERVMGSAWPS
ncbi:HD domain-containing protein [Streptomyces sp. ME03-5709C]|nr:HD domain-containing protein [Streptomyces sp. ME03-5709C]